MVPRIRRSFFVLTLSAFVLLSTVSTSPDIPFGSSAMSAAAGPAKFDDSTRVKGDGSSKHRSTTTTTTTTSTTTSTTSTSTTTSTTSTTVPVDQHSVELPYAPDSAWNTPIGADAPSAPASDEMIARLATRGPLTSDPNQYTYPVYEVSAETPRRTVKLSGWFSTYTSDSTRVGHGYAPTVDGVPIPDHAAPSPGTDGSIIFWDPATGDEWALWQFQRDSAGNLTATNGYRYNTRWSGRFFDGKAGRGAGVPYLAGLVRREETEAGRIDHALAFAYAWPSPEFVYPASKSDGLGVPGVDIPQGARLQLDPSLGEADFDRFGLSVDARVIARALQQYGMIVVDNSGSSKVMIEDEITADWGSRLTRHSLSAIPWDHFRVIAY
jgi:hypothetical protein